MLLRTILAGILLVALYSWASAQEYPQPTVTVCAAGCDFVGINQAFLSIKNTGGTVLIAPGVYPSERLYMANRQNDFAFVAMDPADRPVLPSGRIAWSSQSAKTLYVDGLEFDGLKPDGSLTSGAVIIGLTGNHNIVVRNSLIHHYGGNCVFTGHQDPQYWSGTFVEITDTEIHHCGQGNAKHNVYVHAETVIAERLYSHNSRGSHAFKSVSWNYRILDSIFESGDNFPPATTLIDIAACGRGIIRGNILRHKMVPWTSGRQMLHFRDRISILGCDQPPYNSAEFLDPDFWFDVGDPDDPTNPEALAIFVSGNIFEAVGAGDLSRPITTNGTYPTDTEIQFSAISCPQPVPPEWVERSRIYVAENTFLGAVDGPYWALLPNVGFGPDRTSLTQEEIDGLECTVPGDIDAAQFFVPPIVEVDVSAGYPPWFLVGDEDVFPPPPPAPEPEPEPQPEPEPEPDPEPVKESPPACDPANGVVC